MRIVIFCHSLLSDWNHGNAHFLRGVVTEMLTQGHQVDVYEPAWAWSLSMMTGDHGRKPIEEFHAAYPQLMSHRFYGARNAWVVKERIRHAAGKLTGDVLSRTPFAHLDLDRALKDADLVLVHEWNEHYLVAQIGEHHKERGGYQLLFHDTHHRSVTEPKSMRKYDLSGYDGVLAFGNVIRDLYLKKGWAKRAWTWHEAADTRVFHPYPNAEPLGDLVWIGNWGDDERAKELRQFLIDPADELGLKAKVYGVRYPESALEDLEEAGIDYAGWLPNYKAPETFARYRFTVHVPRRPYVESLPGIPTIRVFEALACGIPLICSPWNDAEGLFTPGEDFLMARNGEEMKRHMKAVMEDSALARRLAERGLETILKRHTCAHRVEELMGIVEELKTENKGVKVSAA